jgi:hypothetical protein
MAGTLRQLGRARDVVTAGDGTASVIGAAEVHLDVDGANGNLVRALSVTPPVDGLDAFIGARAGSGFRKLLDLQTDARAGSLAYLLLDDVPGATLVSGYAVSMAAERGDPELAEFRARLRESAPRLQVPDLCAGWQEGGSLLANLVDGGSPSTLGPPVPSVLEPDDPDAWHELEPLPPNGMRRARRLDVWRGDDALTHVDVFFRDSMMQPDGEETGVHEYTLEATVDPATMVVVACRAEPRVLPWRECPEAIASAGRVVGWDVEQLRPEVRTRLVGPTTCTHLNDVLRGLEDVAWLSRALPR